MFSFTLPREIDVTINVCQLQSNVISWADLREAMGNVALLINSSLHHEGKIFTMHSSNHDRLSGFTRGMVAFYDAFFEEMTKVRKLWGPTLPAHPRPQPALVAQLHSNALHPQSLFIHFLNSIIETLGIHLFFESIEGGMIILVQDRASFTFVARAVAPSFVDTILAVEASLLGPDRPRIVTDILGRLGISL